MGDNQEYEKLNSGYLWSLRCTDSKNDTEKNFQVFCFLPFKNLSRSGRNKTLNYITSRSKFKPARIPFILEVKISVPPKYPVMGLCIAVIFAKNQTIPMKYIDDIKNEINLKIGQVIKFIEKKIIKTSIIKK